MGGVNIPLPELDLPRPAPNPAPDPLSEFARASQLQAQAAQTQGFQQQNQMQQLQLEDARKLRSLAPKHIQKDQDGKLQGFDTEGYLNDALQSSVNPSTVNALRNQYYESVKNAAGATKAQRDNENAANDQIFEIGQSLRDLGKKATPQPVQPTGGTDTVLPSSPQGAAAASSPANLQATPEMMAAWHQALPKLMRLNPQAAGQLNPNQFPTEDQIDSLEAGLGLHKQVLSEAKEIAQTQEAAGKGAESQAEAGLKNIQLNLAKNATPGSFDQQIDGIYPPKTALAQAQNLMLKGQINAALSRGDVESAKKIVAGALENVQAVNKDIAVATNPDIQAGKIAVAKAEAENRPGTNTLVENGKNQDGSPHMSLLNTRTGALSEPTGAGAATIQAKGTNAPTQQMKTSAFRANTALAGIPDVINDVDRLKDKLGPVMGRWNEFMQGKVGADDPDFAGLRADMTMLSTAVTLAHAQGRMSDSLKTDFSQMLNQPKQTPANIKATLGKVQNWMERQTNLYGPNSKPTTTAQPSGQNGAGSITVTDPRGTIHTFKDQASADNFKRLANIK